MRCCSWESFFGVIVLNGCLNAVEDCVFILMKMSALLLCLIRLILLLG